MAGLPAASAIVLVGPPLAASAARFGLALMSKVQVLPSSMLCPATASEPPDVAAQLRAAAPTVLPEMIELRIAAGESSTSMPPALPLFVAELPTMVTCVRVADEPAPGWNMMAPPKPEIPPALLPLKVLLA